MPDGSHPEAEADAIPGPQEGGRVHSVPRRILQRVVQGGSDANIGFDDLCALLRSLSRCQAFGAARREKRRLKFSSAANRSPSPLPPSSRRQAIAHTGGVEALLVVIADIVEDEDEISCAGTGDADV